MVDAGIYQHYKGNYYQVLESARHSETLEPMVVYRSLYGDFGLWVRPAGMFNEYVTINNKQVLRFTRVTEESITPFFENNYHSIAP